jgi:hypothetical protein
MIFRGRLLNAFWVCKKWRAEIVCSIKVLQENSDGVLGQCGWESKIRI